MFGLGGTSVLWGLGCKTTISWAMTATLIKVSCASPKQMPKNVPNQYGKIMQKGRPSVWG